MKQKEKRRIESVKGLFFHLVDFACVCVRARMCGHACVCHICTYADECRQLTSDTPDVSPKLCQALEALQDRPVLFKWVFLLQLLKILELSYLSILVVFNFSSRISELCRLVVVIGYCPFFVEWWLPITVCTCCFLAASYAW